MTGHEHDDLLKRLDSLNQDVPPMPEDFHEGWVRRLEDEAMETGTKKLNRKTLTRVLSIAAALVFVIGGTLLARQAEETGGDAMMMTTAQKRSANTNGYDMGPMVYGVAYDEVAEAEEAGYGVAAGAATMVEAPRAQMMIRTASLTIGTQRYDESLTALLSLCGEMGGWTSSSSENEGYNGLRTCYLTLRVPSAQLDAFLSGSGEVGRVTYRYESAEDVTENYYDTRARLETQQALMARLQALVTDAASLSDLLELEAQIADTQYQIDRLQTSLNGTERQVNFSTVDITLREENAAADIVDGEKSLGERLVSAVQSGGKAFLRLIENGVVFLAAALPFIAIVAAVWVVCVIIRRVIRKRK